MQNLILLNMAWNGLFVAMALSEMTGLTAVHGSLPRSLKWIWLIALAGGNLVLHCLMLVRTLGGSV